MHLHIAANVCTIYDKPIPDMQLPYIAGTCVQALPSNLTVFMPTCHICVHAKDILITLRHVNFRCFS